MAAPAAAELDPLSSVTSFLGSVSDPAVFLRPSGELQAGARAVLEQLYGAAPKSANHGKASGARSRIHVANFDTEQIWQQLEWYSAGALKRARKVFEGAQEAHAEQPEGHEDAHPAPVGVERLEDQDDLDGLEHMDYDAMLQQGAGLQAKGSSDDDGSGEESLELADDAPDVQTSGDLGSSATDETPVSDADAAQAPSNDDAQAVEDAEGSPNPLDDAFFHMAEMDAFLQQGDEAEAQGDPGGLHSAPPPGQTPGGSRAAAKPQMLLSELGEGEQEPEEEGEEDEDGSADDESVDLFADVDEEGLGNEGGNKGVPGGAWDSDADDDDVSLGGSPGRGAERPAGEGRSSPVHDGEPGLTGRRSGPQRGTPTHQDATTMMYEEFFGPREAPRRARKDHVWPQQQKNRRSAGVGAQAVETHAHDTVDALKPGEGASGRAPAQTRARAPVPAQRPAGAAGPAAKLSSHEQRVQRIQQQILAMEEQALEEKEWYLRGEATAASRPVDSALELDLDFEATLQPPPQPTAELTASVEQLVRQRVLDMRFDNVVRVQVQEASRERTVVTLDDQKSAGGLADVYEADLKTSRGESSKADQEKESVRKEAQQVYRLLCAKLDALSDIYFKPKPVVQDIEVTASVPALAMEEALPITMSAAAMKAPEEALGKVTDRAAKAATELSQPERKQMRAKRKRVRRRQQLEKEAASGVHAHPKGIKSAREDAAAAKAQKQQKQAGNKAEGGKARVTSTTLFKQLQDEQQGSKAGKGSKRARVSATSASKLRL